MIVKCKSHVSVIRSYGMDCTFICMYNKCNGPKSMFDILLVAFYTRFYARITRFSVVPCCLISPVHFTGHPPFAMECYLYSLVICTHTNAGYARRKMGRAKDILNACGITGVNKIETKEQESKVLGESERNDERKRERERVVEMHAR